MKKTYLMTLRTNVFFISLIFSSLILFNCAAPKTSMKLDVQEARPGLLAGYLDIKELPVSLALIPPPPEEGSTAFELDKEISKNTLEQTDSTRWEQAKIDANLYFPDALQSFSGIVDVPISEETTPNLYILLRRTLSDAGLSTYTAKNHYKRTRPFMANGEPTCTPEDEEHLMKDGSYPSGHTAIGWAWALVLSEIFPENTNKLIARGREFGESRIVCNVHWQSDVNEGRFIAAATVAKLHGNETFLADMKAAKKEVHAYRKEHKQ